MTLRTSHVAIVAALGAIFIAGSAGKAAAQSAWPMPNVCTLDQKPVCGERSKMKFTYANAGCATLDGAKVVSQGACKAPKAAKKAKKGGKKAAKKPAKKADKKK